MPLGLHGGSTPTYAPHAASPAVDAALDSPCPAADQRGVMRPVDGDGDATATCDCGAVEFELPLFEDGFETGDMSAELTGSQRACHCGRPASRRRGPVGDSLPA